MRHIESMAMSTQPAHKYFKLHLDLACCNTSNHSTSAAGDLESLKETRSAVKDNDYYLPQYIQEKLNVLSSGFSGNISFGSRILAPFY